jgi:hypothetical protein
LTTIRLRTGPCLTSSGGAITSDGGALLLGATDKVTGLIRRFAACFIAVSEHLAAKGELLRGAPSDATLFAASPSTKNKERRRDPEMSPSKKGNQWYFGMKAHA